MNKLSKILTVMMTNLFPSLRATKWRGNLARIIFQPRLPRVFQTLAMTLGSFLLLTMMFFFVLPASAQAAERYWVGGTGNWSDNTNHWAASSNGSPGASTPSASDNCNFDGSSF